MADAKDLSLAELLPRIQEFMPPIVPVKHDDLGARYLEKLVTTSNSVVGACNQVGLAYRELLQLFVVQEIYFSFERQDLLIDPVMIVIPLPDAIAEALGYARREGKELLKESQAADRKIFRLQQAINEYTTGSEPRRLIVIAVECACSALQGGVAALTQLGKVFLLCSDCRKQIFSQQGREDNRDASRDESVRQAILDSIARHKQALQAMDSLRS
jgi:hypothetical protein